MSTADDAARPTIEVVSDEDWKSAVKAEDAKRDAEWSATHQEQPTTGAGAAPEGWPAASIGLMIEMFATQALVALGLGAFPDQQPQTDLNLARHFIDLLGVLEDKTKGNLTTAEAQMLEHALHDLRMAFVEQSRRSASPPG